MNCVPIEMLVYVWPPMFHMFWISSFSLFGVIGVQRENIIVSVKYHFCGFTLHAYTSYKIPKIEKIIKRRYLHVAWLHIAHIFFWVLSVIYGLNMGIDKIKLTAFKLRNEIK